MDKTKEVARLRKRFGKDATILCLPEENPTEIICETVSKNLLNQSIAVAVIEKSAPHFHGQMTEVYIVEEGALTLHYDGHPIELSAGDALVITPGHVHWAEGYATVKVIASPAWTPEDHIPAP
jgi:mannose-6-phosphate isomerase-like protein (cupin superfamily)